MIKAGRITGKNKDFVLIYPPTHIPMLEFPVGGLFLAKSLLEKNFTVGIINEHSQKDVLNLIDEYANDKTLAFGISIVSGSIILEALSIGMYLRKYYPGIPIIWGGAHVTALPEQTLQSELVDYIICGEGEDSLPELLNAIKNGIDFPDIKGFGYSRDGNVIITEKKDYTSLDGLFDLPYHLLDINKYFRKLNLGGERWLGGLYSRGCPYKCFFCVNSIERLRNSSIRFHSVDHIISDIKHLVTEFGADGITILDDHFFINEKRLVDICKALIKENLNCKFRTATRIDALSRISDSTYQLLKEAGFIAIGAGIESGSTRILKYINKNITLDQVYQVDSKLTEFDFKKHWNFMTAIPGETIEDIYLTLKLIVRLAKTSIDSPYPFGSYNKFLPLPGTRLSKIAVDQYGLIAPQHLEDWGNFSLEYENNRKSFDKRVRPWLKGELAECIYKAEEVVQELNSHYTGLNPDLKSITKGIDKISSFINMEKVHAFGVHALNPCSFIV